MTLGQMQVFRRGFQVTMPQDDLNGAQIGPRLQEMSGEAVAQSVRTNAFGETRVASRLGTGVPNGVVGNGSFRVALVFAAGEEIGAGLLPAPVFSLGLEQ